MCFPGLHAEVSAGGDAVLVAWRGGWRRIAAADVGTSEQAFNTHVRRALDELGYDI